MRSALPEIYVSLSPYAISVAIVIAIAVDFRVRMQFEMIAKPQKMQ